MTRANLQITLSNGKRIKCVAESSGAPEQGYIVENLLLPLLSLHDANKETALLKEDCTMGEQRSNAGYRYVIDLRIGNITVYEERYNYEKGVFKRGTDITRQYISYLKTIQTELDKAIKRRFKHLSNHELVDRANGLPDFKWYDEGYELNRRSILSNGGFHYRMKGNRLMILKDNPTKP